MPAGFHSHSRRWKIVRQVGQAPAGVRREIRFSVQDTGIGIPLEQQEAIFEPFAQVDASLARNHDGVDLGLAISNKLVELMGGKIRVKSEPGKGSCFFSTSGPRCCQESQGRYRQGFRHR